MFAASGVLGATWMSRLPAVRDQVGATPGELGTVLLLAGLGSLVTMPLTGRLTARFGSRAVVAGAAAVAVVGLVLIGQVRSLPWLGVVLFCWGMGFGGWDVAMNVQGSHVEQWADRAWMPRYHASWSVGGVLGATAGALSAHAGVPLARHLVLAAAACTIAVAVGLAAFVPDSRTAIAWPAGEPDQPPHGHRRLRVDRRLAAIGAVTLCATATEGAANDWLALLLTDDLGVEPGAAASGYAVFAVAMALARFSGTWVLERLGRVRTVRLAGVVAGLGVVLTVAAPALPLAWAGAALWGLGIALVFPASMSAGGETEGHAADGIAVVSTIGYGGFLIGPPLIGHLADVVGLGSALLTVGLMAAGITTLAGALRPVGRPGGRGPRRAAAPASGA